MTESDHTLLEQIIKRACPTVRSEYYGIVILELAFRDSVMGRQPKISFEQSIRVEK